MMETDFEFLECCRRQWGDRKKGMAPYAGIKSREPAPVPPGLRGAATTAASPSQAGLAKAIIMRP
jgi:hypothetical protein